MCVLQDRDGFAGRAASGLGDDETRSGPVRQFLMQVAQILLGQWLNSTEVLQGQGAGRQMSEAPCIFRYARLRCLDEAGQTRFLEYAALGRGDGLSAGASAPDARPRSGL